MPATWNEVVEGTEAILRDYLFKVEWHYGDNRAPFEWPPSFSREGPEGPFLCRLISSDPPHEPLVFRAATAAALPAVVQQGIIDLFGDIDSKVARTLD